MIDPEEMFPPKPGGMVDTVRKRKAAEQAQADSLSAAPEAPVKVREIPVRDVLPDLGVPRTITLSSANPIAQLLPQDENRRSAIILAIDNDVYVSNNEGNAQNVSGTTSGSGSVFYLPAGIAIPILNTAAWWVVSTTSDSSRISIIISRDSE